MLSHVVKALGQTLTWYRSAWPHWLQWQFILVGTSAFLTLMKSLYYTVGYRLEIFLVLLSTWVFPKCLMLKHECVVHRQMFPPVWPLQWPLTERPLQVCMDIVVLLSQGSLMWEYLSLIFGAWVLPALLLASAFPHARWGVALPWACRTRTQGPAPPASLSAAQGWPNDTCKSEYSCAHTKRHHQRFCRSSWVQSVTPSMGNYFSFRN